MTSDTALPATLDVEAMELAPMLASFGIDAVDLDMLKRGDMLGPLLGAKLFAALSATRTDLWELIETAPKDGASILIWKPDEPRVGEYMMSAYWCDDQEGFVPVGGLHKQGYFSEWAGRDQGYPTHWQSLPAPPITTEGE